MDTSMEGRPARTVLATVSALVTFVCLHIAEHPCDGLKGSLAISATVGAFMYFLGGYVLEILCDNLFFDLLFNLFELF
jgi:hypothetical protein